MHINKKGIIESPTMFDGLINYLHKYAFDYGVWKNDFLYQTCTASLSHTSGTHTKQAIQSLGFEFKVKYVMNKIYV